MRQVNRSLRVGRVACAVILSCLVAGSPVMDGFIAVGSAYAAESAEVQHAEAEGGYEQGVPEESGTDGAEGAHDAGTSSDDAGKQGATTGSAPDENASPSGTKQQDGQLAKEVVLKEEAAAAAPGTGEASVGVTDSGQIEGNAPLAGEGSSAIAGVIAYERLRYEVRPDGTTVDIAGVDAALEGDVVVPARIRSGAQEFVVTGVAKGAFSDASRIKSVSLPATVDHVAADAFDGCSALASIDVSRTNESFSSFDGMLLDAAGQKLVRCPEGKQGTVTLPKTATEAAPDAFEGCAQLTGVDVVEGNESFASFDGLLCSGDLKTVVFCPAGFGDAVALSEATEAIGPKAFAACALAAITVPGNVCEIAADAFSEETRASAVVALPAGEDYDARKAVWEAAGFANFAEPATPGEVAGPAAPEGDGAQEASGFAYTLLDDYTLSVAWTGPVDPDANLEIPATAQVGGASYRVSAVAPSAFEGRASLASVKLPAGVTSVGDRAFAGCANLTTVDLPAGLRAIGARAFQESAIANLWLPTSVATVGEQAFAACASLTRVVAPGAPQVAADALAECAGVTVYCPVAAATSWNVGVPAAGNHLAPYGVELASDPLLLHEGESASIFEGEALKAPEGVQVSYAYAAKPISVDQYGMVEAKAAGTSEVAVSLTLDGVELARATRAIEVTEAPQVEQEAAPAGPSEEENAVDNSPATRLSATVQLVQSNGEPLAAINDLTFSAIGQSSGTVYCYEVRANDVNTIAGNLIIPSEYNGKPVYYISNDGFFGASKLTSVYIPDSVQRIGTRAFANCTALESVVLGTNISSIPDYGFASCPNLRDFTVKGHVKSIGYASFSQYIMGNGMVKLYAPAVNENYDEFLARESIWTSVGFDGRGVNPMSGGALSFDMQGGSHAPDQPLDGPSAQILIMGEKGVEPTPPTKDHHAFGGWWTSPNGEGTQWNFATSTMPSSDTTLYAKWIPYTYSITFAGNGSTAGTAPARVTATYDKDVTMPANTFQRPGYTFTGWNTARDGSGTPFAAGATATKPNLTDQNNGSVTLYAQWKANPCTVTFVTNGGGEVATQTVNKGETASKPAAPSKTGYSFSGWYRDEALSQPYDFSSSVQENIILYAKWDLVISYEAPASPVVTIDATGKITSSERTFKSKSAGPIKVTAVTSEQLAGASSMFPDASTRDNLKLVLSAPGKSSVSLGLAGSVNVPASAGFEVPENGTLSISFGIERPPGSRLNYFTEAKDVARITYTVKAAVS